ncbi:PREDICTED: juvenile hormone epoxide hydrolase 1-like [Ceratosolen solmsi marchali]|uniref:Epoxide hydrolase n=1 Tax=Ceratosolen solmsi marchali TaxID=326594 RepID=A0AAJ6YCE6_9HYME|nr:PREDICTED: juvenile hormone epoxide hydrolase 1-like [Ceratosolen solmsi marchali]
MWKGAAVLILGLITVDWHFRYRQSIEIPKLDNDYWGPGKAVPDSKEIKPFEIDVAKEVIDDLNHRLDISRNFAKPLEGVGWTYGIQTPYLKTILNYWRNKYNWSERQALLNKYPQFITKIQGLDIHFYRIKPEIPKGRNMRILPLLIVHGWPGSVVEFQKIIPLLTRPQANRDFVFEVIAPSIPGFGYSSGASKPGLSAAHIAVVFKNLMSKLGIEEFYVQGGDWGSIITSILAQLYPKNVIGAHASICYVETSKSILKSLIGSYIPYLVIDSEYHSRMYPLSDHLTRLISESGYMHLQATKPDTVGVGLTDSPAGLAAYVLEKFSTWTNPNFTARDDGGLLQKFTVDELLDNLMIYWITSSITTSQRLYAETFNKAFRKLELNKIPVEVPAACAMFPNEIFYQPESLLSEHYTNIIQFTHLPRGGHFAAMEEPQLLADDIWSFARKVEQQIINKSRGK